MSIDLAKHVFGAGEGEKLNWGGPAAGNVTIMIDPDNSGPTDLCVLTQSLDPGSVVPVHHHEKAEQVLYIVSGGGQISLGDRQVEARAGATVRPERSCSRNRKHRRRPADDSGDHLAPRLPGHLSRDAQPLGAFGRRHRSDRYEVRHRRPSDRRFVAPKGFRAFAQQGAMAAHRATADERPTAPSRPLPAFQRGLTSCSSVEQRGSCGCRLR